MTVLTVNEARTNLYTLIDEVAASHKPVLIKGRRNTAVILSEEDWGSMKEELYLKSIPGMWESIERASKEPLSECTPWREVFNQ